MALPKECESTVELLNFAVANEIVHEANHREAFNRLKSQAKAGRRFVNALETLSQCRLLPLQESETMDALDRALSTVIDATRGNDGALLVKDDSNGDLIFALVHGDVPKTKLLWQRIPAGRGVAHWCSSHRRATIVNNTMNDERFYSGIDAANGFCTRSIVAAPLLDGDDVIGVIEVLNKKSGEFFTMSDQNHLSVMAHFFAPLLIQLRDRSAE